MRRRCAVTGVAGDREAGGGGRGGHPSGLHARPRVTLPSHTPSTKSGFACRPLHILYTVQYGTTWCSQRRSAVDARRRQARRGGAAIGRGVAGRGAKPGQRAGGRAAVCLTVLAG